MSPEPPDLPASFGRTPAQAARGALLLAVLGMAVVFVLGVSLARPTSPVGALLQEWGLPPESLPAMGVLLVLGLAATGFATTASNRRFYRFTADGLEVTESLGTYVLGWDNIKQVGEAAGGGLGVRVHSRPAVLESHLGTPQQREWLRTMEPYGEWDFLYPKEDLGIPAAEVLRRMQGWRTYYARDDVRNADE